MESGPRMFKKQHGGKNKNIAQIKNLTPRSGVCLVRSEFIQVQIINREALLGLHFPISVQNIKALWGCGIPSRPKEGRLTWQQHVSPWGTLTFKGLFRILFATTQRTSVSSLTLCCSIHTLAWKCLSSQLSVSYLQEDWNQTALKGPRGCLKIAEIYLAKPMEWRLLKDGRKMSNSQHLA